MEKERRFKIRTNTNSKENQDSSHSPGKNAKKQKQISKPLKRRQQGAARHC